MDPVMMQRMQVMMRAPMHLDSPAALYGQAEALGLSEGQKQELMDIENEARTKALAVLTPEQRRKMGDVPDQATAMMQMCSKMMPMMRGMMGGGGMDTSMMPGGPRCPMMGGMGGGRMPAGSAGKSEGSMSKP